MTATVLRSAQSRLAEEREERLRARAGEELAMVDIRRAREESKQLKDDRRAQDRRHVKALAEQRKQLEESLRRAEGEQEAAVAALKREREHTAEMLREAHADHTRELEEQLVLAQEERQLLLEEVNNVRKQEQEEARLAAQREANAKLDEEKEKRIGHLQTIGVRRLLKQGLARGFGAWQDAYREEQRQKNLLRQCGNRLTKPKLTAAFSGWKHDWDATQASLRSMSHEQRLEAEMSARHATEMELAHVRAQLEEAQTSLAADRSAEEARQRQLAGELEAEKEKRVAALQQQGMKRLMNQGLARGWSAWYTLYSEHRRKKNLLKQAGARLTKPKLINAYLHWRRDWDAITKARSDMSVEARVALERADRQQYEEELRRELKQAHDELKEMKNAIASAKNHEHDLKREMEDELEREKEKRVEHLSQMGVKRLMNQGLARGWGAWHGIWFERRRQQRLLKQAGSRLTKPALISAYQLWRKDWEIQMHMDKTMSHEERLRIEIARADAAEDEVRRLRKELAEARDLMASGKGQEMELKRRMEEELELEKEKRVAHLQQMGMKRLMNQGIARGWSAWHGMWSEKQRQKRLLKQAGARLTKPKLTASYAHWRKGWGIEMRTTKSMTASQRLAHEAAQRQHNEDELNRIIGELKAELKEAKRRLDEGEQSATALKNQMASDLEVCHEGSLNLFVTLSCLKYTLTDLVISLVPLWRRRSAKSALHTCPRWVSSG